MAINIPTTAAVRDQYASYVDPRSKDTQDYNDHGEAFDAWLAATVAAAKAEGVTEGYAEGRTAGVKELSQEITMRLKHEANSNFIEGSESGVYKSGIVAASFIVSISETEVLGPS